MGKEEDPYRSSGVLSTATAAAPDPVLSDSNEKLPATSSRNSAAPIMTNHSCSGGKSNTEGGDPSQDAVPSANEYPKSFSLLFIVLAIILGIFLASLDMVRPINSLYPNPQGTMLTFLPQTIVATAIPKITDEFGGIDLVSWYGSAFFMTNGGFQSSWGKAYKYFSLKYTYIAAIFVFEVGSLICALAPNAPTLIVGRAVCGVGAAGIGTGAYTIIGFVAEPKRRPTFTGFVGLSHGLASILGPLIGGVFSDHVTWRWCFWINLPIGGVSALTVFFFFQPPSSAKPAVATWREKLLQMDLVGVGLVMSAILCYLLALQYGGEPDTPWRSGRVIGLIVGFVVLCVAFGLWEWWQGERAMVVPRLFGQRTIGLSALFTLFFSGSYFLVIYYLPIYFQSVHNTSSTMSGVYNLPLILIVAVAMIASGMMITKWRVAVPIKIAGSMIAMIGSALFYTFKLDSSLGEIIGYQLLGGLGWGLAFQVPIIISQRSASPEDIACITAMVLCEPSPGKPGTSKVQGANLSSSLHESRRNHLCLGGPVRLCQQDDQHPSLLGSRYRSRKGYPHRRDADTRVVLCGRGLDHPYGLHGGHQGRFRHRHRRYWRGVNPGPFVSPQHDTWK